MTTTTATNYILSNSTIMNFLTAQALDKVAADIRQKTGSGTTSKAVQLLLANGRDKTIGQRFQQYMQTGVSECAKMRIEATA